MPETVNVRPARDANGNPKMVPRRPLGMLRVRGGEWPREAVKPEGEALPHDRYIKRLLVKGDLVLVEGVAPVTGSEVSGESPAGWKRKSKPEGE